MKEEKIKLECITLYPEIEILGVGKFKKDKEYEFSVDEAEKLLASKEWKKVKEKKLIEENKFKSKKNEVKNG